MQCKSLMKTTLYYILFSALFSFGSNSYAGCNESIKGLIQSLTPQQLESLKSIPVKWFDHYSTEEIGELIVKRHHQINEAKTKSLNTKSGFNYNSKKIKIALSLRENDLFGVLDDKQFLNMHQTRSTNGDSILSQRIGVENRLSKLEFGDEEADKVKKSTLEKMKELRPKSAYLFLGKWDEYKELGETKVRRQYGDIFAVLKNETKKRALFTLHDSLAASKAYSFNIRPRKPKAATPDMMGDYTAYFEAQIFGKLTLDDVDHWLYDVSDMSSKEIKELIDTEGTSLNRLLKAGIPVYKAKYVNFNGRNEVTKGSKIVF